MKECNKCNKGLSEILIKACKERDIIYETCYDCQLTSINKKLEKNKSILKKQQDKNKKEEATLKLEKEQERGGGESGEVTSNQRRQLYVDLDLSPPIERDCGYCYKKIDWRARICPYCQSKVDL